MSDGTVRETFSVNNILISLANSSKPRRTDLELRKVRKMAERKRLKEKIKRQIERMTKLASEMKASEASINAVNVELVAINQQLTMPEAMDPG